MKDRLVVLGLAAGALALFYVLMFPKPQPDNPLISRPLAEEPGPGGYLAVWRWLARQHVPEVSLRQRYDQLEPMLPTARGNLLIMSMPQRVPAWRSEITALQSWVERGNTLLILAALDDTPLWSVRSDPLFAERLERIAGLDLNPPGSARTGSAADDTERAFDLRPRGAHPLLAGVARVSVSAALPGEHWRLSEAQQRLPLELLARTDGDPVLWLASRGGGQILLCAVASPFSNDAVALADNARLLANIITWSLGPGGSVVFDDAHQGLTEYYDGRAFFADPRLHRTLLWLVVLWLLFVIGAQPLRARFQAWQPLAETTYVEASARYLAAVVPREDAARHLVEQFLESLRARLALAGEGSVWEWLRAHAGIASQQLDELQAIYAIACAGERVDLVRLQNLLAHLRGKLE